MTFYYLTGDVTFLAGQMIARFVAHSASRKQQTTFKIQIKQENVYYIYESIDLYSILYIIFRSSIIKHIYFGICKKIIINYQTDRLSYVDV